jgi:hypothetical protein
VVGRENQPMKPDLNRLEGIYIAYMAIEAIDKGKIELG